MSKKSPNNKKKRLFFFTFFVNVFLMDFEAKLVSQGGGRGPQKSEKKSEKTVLGTFLVSSCASGSILDEISNGKWSRIGAELLEGIYQNLD